jgi:hypothetical protein
MITLIAAIVATPMAPPDAAETIVRAQSAEIVRHFMDRDMTHMIRHVHPNHGVRFSPYPALTKSDQVFTPQQVLGLFNNRNAYSWGMYPGTGDPVKMTFSEYYKRFVYARDFSQAPMLTYNTVARAGNIGNNSAEFFQGSRFIDYHWPGTEANGERDWKTLRLVFMPWKDNWLLVAVVNDEHIQ